MATSFASSAGGWDNVWYGWVGDSASTNFTTATSTANDAQMFVWNTWATGSTVATESWATPWINWQSINTTTTNFTVSDGANLRQPAPTAAELKARREREATAVRKRKQLEAAREVAQERAKVLLEECLSPAQKRAYRRWGTIPVVAASGKRYRIEKGSMGNVVEIKDRKVVARFCCHPTMQGGVVPYHDAMLAQKLMLEVDEEAFLKLANKTTLRAIIRQPRRAVA